MKYLLIFLAIFIVSCDDTKETATETVDPNPLTLIPATFKVVAEVDVQKTMTIEGINSRLRYEVDRKPTLQLLPLDSMDKLYLASGSAKETEESGGLYIAVMKDKTELKKAVKEYGDKFKDNKEVILGTKSYDGKIIHTVRDRKQTVGACQVGPKTIICGPENQILAALKIKENISTNETLKSLRTSHEKYCLSIFVLSAEDSGSLLEKFQFFDRMALSAIKTDKGAEIFGESFSQKTEDNTSTYNALSLLKFALGFKFKLDAKDIQISKEDKTTTLVATLNNDALKDIFVKD